MTEPPTVTPEAVLEVLRTVARDQLGLSAALEPHMTLSGDLQLDSVTLVVVAVALEDHFRVRLEEQDGGALETVGHLVELVVRRAREQRGQAA